MNDLLQKAAYLFKLFVRLLISIVLILLAILHSFSIIKIEFGTLVLLGLVILLWATPYVRETIESFEMPGGLKVKFKQELKDIQGKMEIAGISSADANTESTVEGSSVDNALYENVAKQDPVLGLAGLRIEIERLLREIARLSGLELNIRSTSAGALLRLLDQNDLLTRDETGIIQQVLSILNKAVHIQPLSDNEIATALDLGKSILVFLDEKRQGLQPKQ